MRRARIFTLLILLGASILWTSHGATPPRARVQSITLIAESNANGNTATAVDIVFAYDADAANLLPKNPLDWFGNKAILIGELTTRIDVIAIQVPPATTVNVALPKTRGKAIGVYSYANYIGANRQTAGNITLLKNAVIRLTSDGVVYSERPAIASPTR